MPKSSTDKTCQTLVAALTQALPEGMLDTDALLRALNRAKPSKRAEILCDRLSDAELFCSTEWFHFSASDFSDLPTLTDLDLSGFEDYCDRVYGIELDGGFVQPWDCSYIEVLNDTLAKQEAGLQLAVWREGVGGDTEEFLCLGVGCDTPAFEALAEALSPFGIELDPVPPCSAEDALEAFRKAGAVFAETEIETTETRTHAEDSSNLPIVKVDDLDWAIPPVYYDAFPFTPNGLAAVCKKVGRQKKWGFINAKGETVIPFEYDAADSFFPANQGLAAVKVRGKWGFLNEAGEVVIAPEYGIVQGDFAENGLSWVVSRDKKKGYDGYGYINRHGEMVIPACYATAESFTADGLARVQTGDDDCYWGIIDEKGKFVVPANYTELHDRFSCGLLGVCRVHKGGYVNKRGKEIIPLKYTTPLCLPVFAENGLVARVECRDEWDFHAKWGYLDTKGNIVIPFQFDDAGDFDENGLAAVQQGNRWGFIDAKGEWVIPPRFVATRGFSANCLAVVQETKDGCGFIDVQGEWAIPPGFDNAMGFDERGLAAVERAGKWGVIDARGEIVVPLLFAEVHFSHHVGERLLEQYGIDTTPFIKVSYFKRERQGLYSTTGEVVVPLGACEIDGGFARNGLLRAQATHEGKWGFLRAQGTTQ